MPWTNIEMGFSTSRIYIQKWAFELSSTRGWINRAEGPKKELQKGHNNLTRELIFLSIQTSLMGHKTIFWHHRDFQTSPVTMLSTNEGNFLVHPVGWAIPVELPVQVQYPDSQLYRTEVARKPFELRPYESPQWEPRPVIFCTAIALASAHAAGRR